MKNRLLISLILIGIISFGQNSKISFLFIGDVMEHDLQIQSSYLSDGHYNFTEQFADIQPLIKRADITVANFEVTLSGKPYKGYPKFSSPDDLAKDMKNSGIDIFCLANNHINDYGAKGLKRTLEVLDSLNIKRIGAYLNTEDRKKHSPIIIEQNGMKVALLNYTYGVNEFPIPSPFKVDIIDTNIIKKDLNATQKLGVDGIIVYFHWGVQYELLPNETQKNIANICFNNGANVVIGSHPHVVQPFEYYDFTMPDKTNKKVLVAYSLGNYVSNYGNWRWCDGGAVLSFTFQKENGQTTVTCPKYYLIWVYRKIKKGNLRHYYVMPIVSNKYNKFMTAADKIQLNRFITDYKEHLKKYNINVPEGENIFSN